MITMAILKKNVCMDEILSDWSLAALLLFGGVFTALAGGAAIFLAESCFKKCAKEGSISRFGKTGSSKSGKSSSANPFSGSIGTNKGSTLMRTLA